MSSTGQISTDGVYLIEGDIFLLSQTALKDLGVIPTTFPRIGEFGGIEQQGDGRDRFEVDGPYNIRYIEVEQVPETTAVTGMMENLRRSHQDQLGDTVNTSAHSPATREMRP